MAAAKLLLGGVRLMRLTFGIQIIKANTAKTAQILREPLQPKLNSFAKGKLRPAATAAPRDIIPEYRLVTIPALCGKFLLINAGISTFPKAIAIPNKTVPRYNGKTPSKERTRIPTVSKVIAPKRVLPIPNRLVNKGVIVDTTPKAIRGSVVNNPSNVSESPRSRRIISIKGPILESAGRKFIATNKIPTNNKMREALFNPFSSSFSMIYIRQQK